MADAVDIGSLADELGIKTLFPNMVANPEERSLPEALKLLSNHGLKIKGIYAQGEVFPECQGDFYLDFGSYLIRARVPREIIEIRKPEGYKALNEISH